MNWSFNVGRIAGIRVRVHATTLLLLPLVMGRDGTRTFDTLVLLLMLFAILLAHELGHALTARKLGLPVPEIVLLPVGGFTVAHIPPGDWRSELKVVAAGPGVNLALALASAPFAWSAIQSGRWLEELSGDGALAPGPLLVFFEANLVLGVMNLLPAFPMDGGRLLRAALVPAVGVVRATRVAAFSARATSLLLVALGAASRSLLLPGSFVLFGLCWWFATIEEKKVRLLEAHRRAAVTLNRRPMGAFGEAELGPAIPS